MSSKDLTAAAAAAVSSVTDASKSDPARAPRRAFTPKVAAAPKPADIEPVDAEQDPFTDEPATALSLVGTLEDTEPAPRPEQPATKTTTRAKRKPASVAVPSWRDLPVQTSEPGQLRVRLTVSVEPAVKTALFDRSKALVSEGGRPVNASDLLAAAADTFLADPARWAAVAAEHAPVTSARAAIAGRIPETLRDQLAAARYTTTDGRLLQTGPVLAVIVAAILQQD